MSGNPWVPGPVMMESWGVSHAGAAGSGTGPPGKGSMGVAVMAGGGVWRVCGLCPGGPGGAVTVEWPLWQLSHPACLPPTLAAWLQHTAVTRIHLCHRPTAGLMSSSVKALEHSTWAGPAPGPEAQGLPPDRAARPTRCRGPQFQVLRAPPGRPCCENARRPGVGRAGGLHPVGPEPSLALPGFSVSDCSGTNWSPERRGPHNLACFLLVSRPPQGGS